MDNELMDLFEDMLSEAASIKEFTIKHTFETYKDDKKQDLRLKDALK